VSVVFTGSAWSARDFFYWIGDNPNFPRPLTPDWKKNVLEAEERVFSNRLLPKATLFELTASVPQDNTVLSAEVDEDETPAKGPHHDATSAAPSDTARGAEMDEDQDYSD
jgi:hypothetical protein